jgi:hypothetical protein
MAPVQVPGQGKLSKTVADIAQQNLNVQKKYVSIFSLTKKNNPVN